MLNYVEVSTSELPIVTKKEEGHFTIEQVVYMGENLNDYEPVALLETNTEKQLYEKLYIKK